jgi:integrase
MSCFIENRGGKRKPSYRVQVLIKQGGVIVYRDAKTFSNYRDAQSWGTQRDKALKKALGDPEAWAALTHTEDSVTIGELCQRYQREYSASYGRTVGKDLDALARSKLAKKAVGKLRSGDIVEHIKRRVEGYRRPDGEMVPGVSPATAANDLTRLQTVLDAAWASFDIPVPREEIEKARLECRRRRLVSKPKERTRVATDEELERLCAHFKRSTRGEIPMADIIMFAVHSARRQDEITQLRWADNDEEKLTGIVPRLKDPSGARLDVPFRYTQEAWEIVQRQARTDTRGEPLERIFPYNAKSISAAFARACKVLGVQGLRFHDLRHTAVTRLFRQGYQVHEVPAFSLHRSWATLKRYTNITPDQVELR